MGSVIKDEMMGYFMGVFLSVVNPSRSCYYFKSNFSSYRRDSTALLPCVQVRILHLHQSHPPFFSLSFLSDDTTPGLSFYFYFTFCFSLFISVYCFSNTFSDQVFRTKNYSMWNQDFWVCFRIDMFSNHRLLYLSQVEI